MKCMPCESFSIVGTIYVEPTTEMDVYAGKICEVIREEQKSVVWQKISASS